MALDKKDRTGTFVSLSLSLWLKNGPLMSLTPANISAQNADARGLGYVTHAIPEGKLRLHRWILTTFSLRNKNNANNDGFDARVKEMPASNQRNDISMILLDDCFSFIIGVVPLS